MMIHAAALTHRGKEKGINEDNFLAGGSILPLRHTQCKLGFRSRNGRCRVLFGVFEGAGEKSCGQWASRTAAKTARRIKRRHPFRNPSGLMLTVCRAVKTKVERKERSARQQIEATASMLMFRNREVCLCSTGESQILLYRDGQTEVISKERPAGKQNEAVQEKDVPEKDVPEKDVREKDAAEEHTSEEETAAETDAPEDKETKAAKDTADAADKTESKPYTTRFPVKPGDRYAICSGGVTGMVDPETLSEVFRAAVSEDDLAQLLFQKAMNGGGKDNITVISIFVDEKKKGRNKRPARRPESKKKARA